MIYFTCTSCPPHTTLDHDLHGNGPCLITGCPCQKMVDGAKYVKPVREKMTHAAAKKAAEERQRRRLPKNTSPIPDLLPTKSVRS